MKKWFVPLLLFLLIAPFTPSLDFYFSQLCYQGENLFCNQAPLRFLYTYGEIFGIASGGVALGIFALSFFRPRWRRWRAGSLVMVLTLAIGAGLITNALFKEFWGRPRPKQVIEFGGKHEYRPFWRPNFHTRHDPQKSFPSGHTAMGFYFFSLCFVGRRYRNPLLFRAGVGLTVALGGGLMVGRVMQGGHFFSDVIAAMLLMWIVSLVFDRLFLTSVAVEGQAREVEGSDISRELASPSEASE